MKLVEDQNIIQCRASNGIAIPASQPWEPGKAVEFIYAPAGKHLITAGFRKNESITICVVNDEQTAQDLQESFDHLTATEPNQEPFGDEDHDARKATLRFPPGVTSFKWGKIKSAEGVVVAAEPTSYGAEAVNGKVYRSWSPEFSTDAEYAKAKCKNGHWTFPEGVRGSESNPARIVGVSFVMGALTNKPAFRAMPPVKAKKADGDRGEVQSAGTSEGVKKSWEKRHEEVQGMLGVEPNSVIKESPYGKGKLGDFNTGDRVKFANYFGASEQGYVVGESKHNPGHLRVVSDHGNAVFHRDIHPTAIFGHSKSKSTVKSSDPILAHSSPLTLTDISSAVIQAHQADELTLSDLQQKVQQSVQERFGSGGSTLTPQSVWICDILRDEDEDDWAAVVHKDGKYFRLDFIIDEDDGAIHLGEDLEPTERKTVYAEDAMCFNGEIVKASEKKFEPEAKPQQKPRPTLNSIYAKVGGNGQPAAVK